MVHHGGFNSGTPIMLIHKIHPMKKHERCVKERVKLTTGEKKLDRAKTLMLHAPDNRKARHASRVQSAELDLKRYMFQYKACVGDLNSISEVWYSDGGFNFSQEEMVMMGNPGTGHIE